MKKLAVCLVSALACLLLVEGALSLGFARSVRALLAPPVAAPAPYLATDADRAAAAARSPGPFRVPIDPLVGYTFKTQSEITLTEGQVTMRVVTDDLGLRARSGPAPAEGALRIVVLGDSVAFGFGLDEQQTLAAQLERLLAGLPTPVACSTVAVPSWNARNAWRFLLDHLERFQPDLVLYLPVENDLEDAYGVTEAGQRHAGDDPASTDPLLRVRALYGFVNFHARAVQTAEGKREGSLGPAAIDACLGPLSRARYQDLARTILDGAARLERVKARFALLVFEQSGFQRELRGELLRAGAAPVEIPLLDELQRDDTLVTDPHPSAATVEALAVWVAAALRDLGWLPGGESLALPAVAGRYADRRGRPLAATEVEDWCRGRRARLEAELQHRIAPASLQGILQVYGGLNLDSTLAARFAAVLPRGKSLRVRLAPLEGRPDLYPLEVRVRSGGRLLGSLTVRPGEECEARFELAPTDGPFDVHLEPADWAVVTVRGKSWVAAARLVELESLP